MKSLLFLILLIIARLPLSHAEEPSMNTAKTETATLAGGCFWCTEAIFQSLIGVSSVKPGYTGGARPNPTYEQVSSGASGHAEAVELIFDPTQITYHDLLEIFFHLHDPTTLNRQGADSGTQYRSAIFYHSPEQKKIAEDTIREITAAKLWPDKIVTEVTPASTFYVAEDYHQNYFRSHQGQPYCSIVIAPKIQKLYREFGSKIRRELR
jgi:peptide-methionine (S)-S-oxide reductase